MSKTNSAAQTDRGPTWLPEPWAGGRVRVAKDGSHVFVLERMVDSDRYTKTLEASNLKEALAELALFERDPAGYKTQTNAARVTTDPAIVERFLTWLRKEGRVERYVNSTKHYLSEWDTFFRGRDLRKIPLKDYRAEIARRPAGKSRIIALKSFTAYLREQESVLTSKEDPTLDLRVPPPRPAKATRNKGYKIEHVEALYRAIKPWTPKYDPPRSDAPPVDVQSVRDVLALHCLTGMHATEIERLAKGEGEVKAIDGHGEIAGTFKFVHKSGRVHIQSVNAQALAAAQRLQARGSAPVDSYIRRVINHAVEAWNKQIKWTPGGQAPKDGRQPLKRINFGELRHSFVTWASERGRYVRPDDGGVSLPDIASAIGHASANTTKRFYEGVQVPPLIAVPIKLEHPDDPMGFEPD
jgi:integrase